MVSQILRITGTLNLRCMWGIAAALLAAGQCAEVILARGRPACPSRASGWSSLTAPRGFPCCVRFPKRRIAPNSAAVESIAMTRALISHRPVTSKIPPSTAAPKQTPGMSDISVGVPEWPAAFSRFR